MNINNTTRHHGRKPTPFINCLRRLRGHFCGTQFFISFLKLFRKMNSWNYNRNYNSSYYSSMFWAFNHSELIIMQALYTSASIIFLRTMFNLLWMWNFIKIGKNFNVRTKFSWICSFGSRPSISSTIFISMFNLLWVPNFIKVRHIAILGPNLLKFFISAQDPEFQISNLWLRNLTCSECEIS